MKMNLQKRDVRALGILAVAVVIYFLISAVGVPAFGALSGTETEVADKESQLKKYIQVVGRKGRYAELTNQAKKQVAEVEAVFIRADNSSLAAIEFQTLVEAAAARWGIQLSRRNVAISPQSNSQNRGSGQKAPPASAAPKDGADTIRDMTMTLQFGSGPQQLISFLSELRTGPKFITVLSMNLAPEQLAMSMPKGDFSKNLRVNVTLGAVMQIPNKGAGNR
jgi:hypothetical protein